MVVPPVIYETVHALGYHHLGDLYTAYHRVLRERTLKERAPARKGIAGLRAWLARHAAVMVPLLREPPLQGQAAPKDWIPAAVPAYRADVVIGGRDAKTTRQATVYHRGEPLWVTAAMQDTMEVEKWIPELRVCHQPPGTLHSDTRLHRLLVALLGIQVQVDAPLHARLWSDQHHQSLAQLQLTGVWAPTIVWCGVRGVVWCGVAWHGVVWCGVVWCGVVWCGVVWCGVVWCGVVWCGVVWCGVVGWSGVWCGVVWCAEGAVTRRQWPGCLPMGTGKREGYVSWCALCASVLLYSRDLCSVSLGRDCSADACARSDRVYGAHCTASAVLHQQYFVCGAALLGAVLRTALCVPRRTAGVGTGQWAAEPLQCIASLLAGGGQSSSCFAPP